MSRITGIRKAPIQRVTVRTRERLILIFAIMVCAALAAGHFWGGLQAILDQEMTFTPGRGKGRPLLSKPMTLRGADAVRVGCGFVTLGASFAVWGGGILFYSIIHLPLWKRVWFGRAYIIASLVLVIMTCLLLFPLWTIYGAAFWLSQALFFAALTSAIVQPARRVLVKIAFLSLLVTGCILMQRDVTAIVGASIIAGLFAAVIGFIHALAFFRDSSLIALRERIAFNGGP